MRIAIALMLSILLINCKLLTAQEIKSTNEPSSISLKENSAPVGGNSVIFQLNRLEITNKTKNVSKLVYLVATDNAVDFNTVVRAPIKYATVEPCSGNSVYVHLNLPINEKVTIDFGTNSIKGVTIEK